MISNSNLVNELHTVRDFIRFATTCFNKAKVVFGHGTDNAWDEATQLVFQLLHFPPEGDKRVLGARLTLEERQILIDAIGKRIQSRLPLPYITHQAWQGGLLFYVDERVLIPRSPIAELIQNGFEPWLEENEVTQILDLCTGSGCLAILAAHAFPKANVDAVDISADALEVAKINILQHAIGKQVHLFESDLFAAVNGRRYDVILSNPPYVNAHDMATLAAEFTHEPQMALTAGDDGLDVAKRILAQAYDYLTPNGLLIIEVGSSEKALSEQFNVPFTWLEFENGGQGVFLITREDLGEYQDKFR